MASKRRGVSTRLTVQAGILLTGDLFLGEFAEVIDLSLVRSARAVPEEEPLQGFVALELVGEAKDVLLVGELEKVEQLCTSLHDGERRVLSVVDNDGDAT